MKKQPTMVQIAKKLDLSRMVVSTVINDRSHIFPVAPKTQKRIKDYLKSIGYVRNFHAMGLKKPKRDTLGIYYSGSFNVSHITEALNQMMRLNQNRPRLGLEVKVAPAQECEQAIEELVGRGCNKIIYCVENNLLHFNHTAILQYLRYCQSIIYNAPLNLELQEDVKKHSNLSVIQFDRRSGYQKIAQRLLQLGHQKICLPQVKDSDRSRFESTMAFKSWGLDPYFIHPEEIPYSLGESYNEELVDAILEAQKQWGVTAAVFGDDRLAIRNMNGLIKRGIKVPDQISITGMDGEPWLPFLQISLESVAFPIQQALKIVEGALFEKKPAEFHSLKMIPIHGESLKNLR